MAFLIAPCRWRCLLNIMTTACSGNTLQIIGPLSGGNPTVDSLVDSKTDQNCRVLIISLVFTWTSYWTNNLVAGYLRCTDAYVMRLYWEQLKLVSYIHILMCCWLVWPWKFNPCYKVWNNGAFGRHFPDNIFKWIFLNENVWISFRISLKFVPMSPINNTPALAPTRPQAIIWINDGWIIDAYLRHSASMS